MLHTLTPLESPLRDPFNRDISYLRLSVTDRCDFRCVYCMAETMQFLPKNRILSLEQLEQIAKSFVHLGVRKIRLTGGEPTVRRGIESLVANLAAIPDLEQLHMTTNGARLDRFARPFREAGLTGVNISLDSLKPVRFRELTRTGDLSDVLRGIDAAVAAGFERIKLNAVILKGRNDDEIPDLVTFARQRGIDITFIEEMPLGSIEEHDRQLSLCSSEQVKAAISEHYTLQACDDSTGGPSRYYRMPDSSSRVGFISPHSNNFCHLCNRVRLTVEGRLLLCLGNEHSSDLKSVIEAAPNDPALLQRAIINALQLKPERHHFDDADAPQIVRFMNMTGG